MELELDGIVVTGGEGPGSPYIGEIASCAGLVVAADSGLDAACRHGVRVDYVVGDMDSLEDESLLNGFPAERIRRFDVRKDYTDTELGIRLLAEKGCSRVGVVGGGGGRLDHLVGLLYLFSRSKPPKVWITSDAVVAVVDPCLRILGHRGERVSFFPVSCEPCHMSSVGLEWPLDSLTWCLGDVGISNRIASDEAAVKVESGRLVMVGPLHLLSGLKL